MQRGWIHIHRRIQDCCIWCDEEPFDRRSAWIDLLLSANHRDNQILFNGKPLVIHEGQYLTSVRKLSERWHWSNDRTLRYLRLLESMQMITRDSDSSRTLLTIVNYRLYNNMPNTDEYTDKDTGEYSNKDSDKSQTRMEECKNEKNNILSSNASEIVEYLNLKTGAHFKASSDKTKKLIKARLNEGFTVDDFKTVIDKKVSEWKSDSKMSQYLRPETLFGTKFEGYLNQKEVKAKQNSFNQMEQRQDYDFAYFDRVASGG